MTIERVPNWAGRLEPAAAIANAVAETDFVPRDKRGNVPAITACILYGEEIGVSPMSALQGIHVIDGRPFVGAETMRALVFGAGHFIGIKESTGTRCVVVGYRKEHRQHPVTVEWTMEMARAAGLAGKGAWRSYPRALLLARASAELCRVLFPDVVRGLAHIPETGTPDSVEAWAEMADGYGPDVPAPAPTERVEWSKTARVALGAPQTPASGPTAPPWDDHTPEETEAVKTDPVPVPTLPRRNDDPLPVAEDSATRPIDPDLVRRIMAAYGNLTFGPDRETRLALFTALLSMPVESTNDLDRMTGYRLLGGLARLRDGSLIAIDDGHGGFTIHAGTEPTEDDDA